jgi:hypothetical protein
MTDLPANWYPDPDDSTQLRYWDGSKWTEDRAPAKSAAAKDESTEKAEKPWYKSSWFAIIMLILFFPVGLFLMWKFTGWHVAVKILVTIATIVIVIVANMQPKPLEIEVDSKFDGVTRTEERNILITGSIDGADEDTTVTSDGEEGSIDGSDFEILLPLEEGNNKFEIVVTRGGKTASDSVTIYRLTAEEIEELREEEAKEKAAAAKKKAEAAAKKAADKAEADAKKAEEEAAEAAEEAAKNAPKTSFGEGTYLVNTEIAPGTYKTTGGSNCYYERLSGTSGEFDDIITNDNPTGQAIVTIQSSDVAFNSSGCADWEKIS